jgi:hypothetical protein
MVSRADKIASFRAFVLGTAFCESQDVGIKVFGFREVADVDRDVIDASDVGTLGLI